MVNTAQRIERDLLGEREVPARAYYGVHTLRAAENFPITGTAISSYPDLINALVAIKHAAALANRELGLLEAARAGAIVKACDEIRAGKFHDQFVVDVIQGGAGTSTNMNANEVIANRALEHLGHARGEYQHLHPLEHVNMSQSTNDVYPAAVKLALHVGVTRLGEALADLCQAFEAKAAEFSDVLKMGRTQLQDALPMTLGQEFATCAHVLRAEQAGLRVACTLIHEINLGATAIGAGISAHVRFAELARRHLSSLTGLTLTTASDPVEATQEVGAFVQLSGLMKRTAVQLSKICNDLQLLSSGPRAGLGEISLPPRQAGSSIAPGKVHPVIPEVVNQIAFAVIGNDLSVSLAAEAGQLQLNAFEPIIAHKLFESLRYLRAGCLTLTTHCVRGITADRARLRSMVERSIGIVTALHPYIGHTNASMVAQEALATGQSVYDLVLAKGLLSRSELDDILRPEVLTRPHPIMPIRE
jgi:aspartate ammonia-lyase